MVKTASPSHPAEFRILNEGEHPLIASYARSRKRSLRPRQRQLLEDVLPHYAVTKTTDFPALLAQYARAVLEIGFGNGEHLLGRAEASPDTLFLGSEVFDVGLASCLARVQKESSGNIRLFDGDGRVLVHALPPQSLDRVYILFPDPWPKPRHKKRRLVSRETCDMIVNKLKPLGELILATDHPDYLEWAMVQLTNHPALQWQARQKADWLTPPEGHITTRYQEKAKAGYPRFLVFTRL